jgi:ABC-type uncharacterized transport system auxiliary subunit
LKVHTFKYPIAFFGLVIFVAFSSSCYSTKNVTNEKIISRVEQRNEAVRRYVRADLKAGQRYVDFGFVNERVIKPNSFRRLDSLYSVYHNEEQKPGASKSLLKKLKSEIELERSRVLQDTIHFIYEKPHFFAQVSGDTSHIVFADFLLNAKNQVFEVRFNYYFSTHVRNNHFYRAYLNRESFIDFGFAPSFEELQFYHFFDAKVNSIDDPEIKGRFVEHILQIMHAANQQRGINTEHLIKQHIINSITTDIKSYKPLKWSQVYVNLGDNNILQTYEVDHEWIYADLQSRTHQMRKLFVLSPYFEILEVSDTHFVRD